MAKFKKRSLPSLSGQRRGEEKRRDQRQAEFKPKGSSSARQTGWRPQRGSGRAWVDWMSDVVIQNPGPTYRTYSTGWGRSMTSVAWGWVVVRRTQESIGMRGNKLGPRQGDDRCTMWCRLHCPFFWARQEALMGPWVAARPSGCHWHS